MSDARSGLFSAKRELGRELRTMEGFVGVGVDDESIILYAKSKVAPVVASFRTRYGDAYRGCPVKLILSSGFQADAGP